jgi:tetratricopeptide (TPR) repeat protein
MDPASHRHVRVVIVLSLLGLTCAAYSGLVASGFINYDDEVYVTQNAEVAKGLTPETAAWALKTFEASNWHPLTWLSHLIDVSFFGLHAAGHHVTSLLIHGVNAVLLFLLLEAITGATWRSAAAAALFAIHPLHVESVAWISERKDVLSTLFWLLALWSWSRYAAERTIARYAAVVVLFAMALMAKPMPVTLPFTLLLLDRWPLDRPEPLRFRLMEKAPLFAMSLASCVVTLIAQASGGAIQSLESMSLPERLASAVTAYVVYLRKTIWPMGLAVFYPYPHGILFGRALLSLVVLTTISTLAVRFRDRAPYLLFGWLWFLGTLVPVIGLVQVGGQSMADRYTYVPLIGIFVSATWGLAEIARERRLGRVAASLGAVVAIIAATAVTRAQVAHWRDSTSLFTHTLAVTKDNWLAHNDLGLVLFEDGKTDEAVTHYAEALRIAPNYVEAQNNMGNALERLGLRDSAIEHYRRALALRPGYVRVHNNLGVALAGLGRTNEAIAEYNAALRLDPGYVKARKNLALALHDSGLTLAKGGRVAEAIAFLERSLAMDADSAQTRNDLAGALAASGRTLEAVEQLNQALRLDPGNAEAHFNLGSLLLSLGRNDDAAAQYEKTLELRPEDAEARLKLRAAREGAGGR